MASIFRALAHRRHAPVILTVLLAGSLLACSLSSTITSTSGGTTSSTGSTSSAPTATHAPATATTVPPTATPVPPTATPPPPGNLVFSAFCAPLGTNTIGPCPKPYQTLCVGTTYFYFHFFNNGGQAVNWTSSVALPNSGGGAMVSLSPSTGTVNPGQTVTVQSVGQYGGDVIYTINWNGHASMFDLFCAMP
jgi:hypothetical protein